MPKAQPKIPDEILKRWWWRRLVFIQFDEETHTTQYRLHVPEHPSYGFTMEWSMWHREAELAAFRFEMLRRTTFSDLPEWHAVPTWLASWIRGVLKPKPERAVCGIFAPTAPDGYASLERWQWDLKASDEALCKQFIGRINEARQKIGLPSTYDPFAKLTGSQQKYSDKRRGQRSRPVSWLAVEAHDIKTYGVRQLTDGERSRLSKACREIAVLEGPLRTAIEKAMKFTPEENKISSGEELYARFIREEFLRRFASRLPKP